MATIVTKNSSTASAVPTTSDLVQGELAVNVTDKRIFTENASTQIVELGTNPSTVTTGTATVTGTLTANGTFASNNAVITGGTVNSTPIGATTASTVRGTTVTATTGFVGGLTGNVTGNLTGNVTGNVTGNLTGNVTGNVTASSGTTTLNDLVVNGTADFTNTKLTNITTPTADSDAANKGYVDATVAAVIDSAPAALDTLNELAAALGDDANFSATVTTALATKLPLAGGTMSGAIAMGTSKITGLGDPTASQDAATKIYVDTADNLKLNLSGGTMSGAIAMGTNKITGLGDPTLAQDAATKAYTDSILGSATSAAASAAAAATSESNAATSASNAATSETNALNSANAAASSYDQFDDRYLGDKASDPTLDNDGNALLTGALYFNTTTDVMRVYTGSAWQDVAISTNSPTFTGTVTADGLSLGDNDKATFGNSNDLEIFHNGTDSYISDKGTGDLNIRGVTNVRLQNVDGSKSYFVGTDGGASRLYYSGLEKLATTSTGIDVTGTATMDGLTLDGNILRNVDNNSIFISGGNAAATGANIGLYGSTSGNPNDILLRRNNVKFAEFDGATGDISFYEDTGTTPKFFWDASAESLGIGTATTVSNNRLVIEQASGDGANSGLYLQRNGAIGTSFKIDIDSSDVVNFRRSTIQAIAIDSSGKVGIGTTNPTAKIHILGNGEVPLRWGNDSALANLTYSGSVPLIQTVAQPLAFWISSNEAMRIDASGNLLVGRTSQISSDGAKLVLQQSNAPSLACYKPGTSNVDLARFYSDTGGYGLKAKISGDGGAYFNGNVGIGTSSPAADLHIANSGVPIIRLEDSGSGQYAQIFTNNDDLVIGSDEGNTGSLSSIAFRVDASEKMRIDSNGNVGIGTTNPSIKLQVAAENGSNFTALIENTSGSVARFITAVENNVGIIFKGYNTSNTPQPFIWQHAVSSVERMRIDASGNVGIGTSSPAYLVDAYGAVASRGSGAGNAAFILQEQGNNPWYLTQFTGGTFSINYNGTSTANSTLVINSSGNVGIGNTAPQYQLDLNATGSNTLFGAGISASTASGPLNLSLSSWGQSGGRSGIITFTTGSATNGTEAMRIDASGNLLVGKTSVSLGTAGVEAKPDGEIRVTTDGSFGLQLNRLTSVGDVAEFRKDGIDVGSISVTASTTNYNTSSDQRLKENIADADDAGSKVDAIQVRQFDWKADGSHQDYGMVAQELMTVAPEAVSVPEDPEDMMGVDYSKLVPMLIKEIQSLRNRVATLEGN